MGLFFLYPSTGFPIVRNEMLNTFNYNHTTHGTYIAIVPITSIEHFK